MKEALTTLILCICIKFSFAQNNYPVTGIVKNSGNSFLPLLQQSNSCLSDRMQSELKKKFPELIQKEAEINHRLYLNATEKNIGRLNNQQTTMINIPVVVHIIHNNGPENISDAQVIQGIQDLNDAFNNSGAYYNVNGVATGIQFCLAQQDYFGFPTTGITRMVLPYASYVAETDDNLIKSGNNWDPSHYLNFYLVNEITSLSMGSGIAGYAYFPSAHGMQIDGVVNEARYFGSSTDNSKVHIHEVGHYLGLYHTFNNGCTNNDCFADGDHVCDTPPDNSTTPVLCSGTANTCNSDENDSSSNNPFRAVSLGGLGDQPDMFQNYMDYGLQTCQSQFTPGQKDRMIDAINGERNSLLLSKGCQNTCGAIYASIANLPTEYIADVPFVALNVSFGLIPYTFEWLLDGATVSTDTILNLTVHSAGNHTLTLRLYNTATGCYVETNVVIYVQCNFQSEFSYMPAVIAPGNTVAFTPSLTNLGSYKWYVDGQLASQNATYSSSFSAGGHSVYLIADNGNCIDTSAVSFLPVGNCVSGSNNKWVLTWDNLVDFSSEPPVTSATKANTRFNPGEGIASISDKNANLLFYSDGRTVFNTNSDTLQNGSGLIGGGSSSQAVIIIPSPSLSNIYYIFTTDDFAGANSMQTNGGWLAYSIVDMNLDSGRGAVTQKNNLLMTPTCEKLTATYSCDGQSIWVISHAYGSDEFYSYEVTSAGVDSVPVISHAGATINNFYLSVIGCMKASPKGNKLAAAYRDGFTEIYDFDNATGMVSNAIHIQSTNYYSPYGVEFSPDGSKLYVSNVYDYYFQNEIYQYDLSSGIAAVIASSETLIGNSSSAYRAGALQAAPNGKIYSIDCADYYLDEIANPNEAGLACNFIQKTIRVPNFMNGFGLPNFIAHNDQSFNPKIIGPLTVCSNADSVKYKISCAGSTPVWIHHGPNQLLNSNSTEAIMRFTVSGYDTLIVTSTSACNIFIADTVIIHAAQISINLGNDTSMCSTGSLDLDAGAGFISYLWANGITNRIINVASPITTYAVVVTAVGGCTATDTINFSQFNSTLQINLGDDIYTCGNYGVIINSPPGNFTHYLWQDGSTKNFYPAYMAYNPNYIILEVTDSLGCKASDELVEYSTDSVYASLPSDTTMCNGSIIVLEPGTSSTYSYHWQDNSTSPTFTVFTAGVYWVTVTGAGCLNAVIDTIVVSGTGNPVVDLGTDTAMCPTTSLLLHAGNRHQTYFWQNNSVDSTFAAVGPGTYWVVVADSGCYTIDSILVSGCVGFNNIAVDPDLFIYPNPSSGNIQISSINSIPSLQLEIFNMTGEKVCSRYIIYHEIADKINLSFLSGGMYLTKIIYNNKTHYGRLIIEK